MSPSSRSAVEGLTRTTKWPKHIELAGAVDWRAAAQAFLALPDLLSADGLPTATISGGSSNGYP